MLRTTKLARPPIARACPVDAAARTRRLGGELLGQIMTPGRLVALNNHRSNKVLAPSEYGKFANACKFSDKTCK